MNVLFVSISSLPHISEHSISLDLIHEFRRNGHNVFVVCAIEKKDEAKTNIQEEMGCQVLRVKIGNNKKANIIEKGLTTVFLPRKYIAAIKKYYSDIKFDLVLYPTPPVTQVETVKFIKERDGAKSYLLLKDIFPQNSVDLGMLSTSGIKGIIYKYFRRKEKALYKISDYIGCMSLANVKYVLDHNSTVSSDRIEVCPNSIEIIDIRISEQERAEMRNKYSLPLDKKIFVYGGNLGKPQGIPFVIECLRKLSTNEKAYFLIVGDGTEYNKLYDYICKEKPANVTLMKRLPKDDYDKLVAACDVGMIFLDYRFTIPNFPSRVLGYMQAGLPIIACTDTETDIGKIIEKEQIGWTCPSNNVELFSRCIDKSLEDVNNIQKVQVVNCLRANYAVANSYRTIIKHFEA